MSTTSEVRKTIQWMKTLIDRGEGNKLTGIIDAVMQDKGLYNYTKGQVGKQPIENPMANWEKLLYTPTSFGKNGANLSDSQKKKKIWNSIQLKNITGDLLSGFGVGAGAGFGALAGMAKAAANTSATQAQKNLYGATPEDRFAASATPLYSAAATVLPILSGITANRFYQGANEKRADYLRALMGAQYNNMDVPGMYADSWRKLQDGTDNPFLTTGGQQ